MIKYARIENGVVAETLSLAAGVKISDALHPDLSKLFMSCPSEVQAGWLYEGEGFIKPPPEIINLDAIKAAASSQISAMLDAAADVFTGSSPIAERLSWSVKQDAARAYQAGNAMPDQIKMLEAEAALTRETIDDLASTILTAASTYWAAAGAISGLRRSLSAAITAAKTTGQVQDVLNGAPAQIELVFKGAQ